MLDYLPDGARYVISDGAVLLGNRQRRRENGGVAAGDWLLHEAGGLDLEQPHTRTAGLQRKLLMASDVSGLKLEVLAARREGRHEDAQRLLELSNNQITGSLPLEIGNMSLGKEII